MLLLHRTGNGAFNTTAASAIPASYPLQLTTHASFFFFNWSEGDF
jgi:hypothetical protein